MTFIFNGKQIDSFSYNQRGKKKKKERRKEKRGSFSNRKITLVGPPYELQLEDWTVIILKTF